VSRFVIVGDTSLDILVAQSGPRNEGSDAPAAIRIGMGGQGANVAVRLARLGAEVRLVSAVADDAAGRLLREALEADGVTLTNLAAERSTMVLALLDESGERTMLSDRQSPDASAAADALDGVGWVHCSGYSLLDDHTGDGLAELLGRREATVRCSVAGGSVPREPAAVARLHARVAAARPDLVVLSADEAQNMLGRPMESALAAAGDLGELAPVVVVTNGAAGSAAAAGGLRVDVPAEKLLEPMRDATGTGDAYVAGLLSELATSDHWPPSERELRRAITAGSRLGALVARVVGAQTRVEGERPAS
jgi:sugar/nucleoside kinase (ribokinase family)